MARLSVESQTLLKHAAAAALGLSAEEAVERVSRLEASTSYDFGGKAVLQAPDLEGALWTLTQTG